jgi:hypothetical protein
VTEIAGLKAHKGIYLLKYAKEFLFTTCWDFEAVD